MKSLVPLLNSAAATWFSFVYHVTWQASLLAALLLAVVLLGRRWPSPLRYWLLVLALVKFALPPMMSMPTGLFSHVGPAVKTIRPNSAATPFNPDIMFPAGPSSGIDTRPGRGDTSPGRTEPAAAPRAAAPVLDGKSGLMLLHILGAIAAAGWILRSLLIMRRTLRCTTEVVDGELRRRFTRLSEQLGLRHPPRLMLSHEPCGPAAFGVLWPVVILPDAVTLLESSALDSILAHELAHHRRRDPLINWIQLTLTVMWWFNPVLWGLNRQIRKVREDCCDDILLTRNLTTGPAYCETLLNAASRLAERTSAGVSLGFGDSLHPLGRRFERIMDRTLRRTPRLSLAGMLFLVVLASVVLPGLRRSDGNEASQAAQVEPKVDKPRGDAKASSPAAAEVWPEGATVTGRVLDHRGVPIANAEVLLLGKERIVVDADRKNWFVAERANPNPPSARTDKNGSFTITRKQGSADRLAVIAEDPIFWVVPRNSLKQDLVEIKLPEAGSLAVRCNLPRKPSRLPVMIELRKVDGVAWNTDFLRFHMSTFALVNPGEKVFDHLPPGHYSVQRYEETKTDSNSVLMSGADRRVVAIESAKRAVIRLEREVGQALSGQVRGLENVELRYAHLSISTLGPEEFFGKEEKRQRMLTTFDVIPVTSEGRFTTDLMPPGKYWASLFAVLASTPRLSSQSSDFSGEAAFSVPEKGEMPKVEIVTKPNRAPDLSKVTDLRIRVVDDEGKPVPKPEAMIHTADAGYGPWIEGREGVVFLGGDSQYGESPIQVLVRADGHAPTSAQFTGKQRGELSQGKAKVTLPRGQEVQLRFQLPRGLAWPKGTLTEAYFDDMQERVRMMRQPANRRDNAVSDFNMLKLREVGAGQFEFRLTADTPRFHVAIHTPGFLQYFETGPFTLADVKDGKLVIDVPRPATLDVSFEPGDHPGSDVPFKSASLDVNRRLQGNSFLNAATTAAPSLTPKLKVSDLAPGDYSVSVRTQPKGDGRPPSSMRIDVGAFYDRKVVTLGAGQSERINFRSTPFDPDAFRGTRTAIVHVRTPGGKPAAGRKVSVTFFDGHYGALDVFSGVVPASGDIVLTGISDKALPSSYPLPAYTVSVDDKRLGSFGFTKELPTERFEFCLPPVVGDIAPDVELTNLATGKPMRLSDLRGKVVLLEFWATWCGPCQEPMAKLNSLGNEQRAAWKDKVAIIPVSIDSAQSKVKSHVQQRAWTGLEHFWSGGSGGGDFEAPAARAFVIHGVPESMLIGRDGRLKWRGHPLDKRDDKGVKSRIEDALK